MGVITKKFSFNSSYEWLVSNEGFAYKKITDLGSSDLSERMDFYVEGSFNKNELKVTITIFDFLLPIIFIPAFLIFCFLAGAKTNWSLYGFVFGGSSFIFLINIYFVNKAGNKFIKELEEIIGCPIRAKKKIFIGWNDSIKKSRSCQP